MEWNTKEMCVGLKNEVEHRKKERKERERGSPEIMRGTRRRWTSAHTRGEKQGVSKQSSTNIQHSTLGKGQVSPRLSNPHYARACLCLPAPTPAPALSLARHCLVS